MLRLYYPYIVSVSIIAWLLPPIRQYGTKYFFYFLIIASGDIFGFLYVKFINHENNLIVFYLLAFFCLLSVIDKKHLVRFSGLLWSLIFIVLVIAFWESNNLIRFLIISGLHFAILLVILKSLIIYLFNEKKIDFFLFFLIFYEGTVTTKYIALIAGPLFSGNYYYLITSIFEISIAVVFVLFKYGGTKLIFQFR